MSANKSLCKKIAVTGAAGNIAYSLLFRLANGELYGPDQPIELHLLEVTEALAFLQGVAMELEDAAFPLLKKIRLSSDPYELFDGIDAAFLIGAKPRLPGQERKDLLKENAAIFVEQAKALNAGAKKEAKILVVGNPCNTNAYIVWNLAPNLNAHHIHAMTRLDQNRARFLLAKKAGVDLELVSQPVIWGNHSITQVPDGFKVRLKDRSASAFFTNEWLQHEFVQQVQNRGAAVLAARGRSSAASAASSALDAMHDLIVPTPQGCFYSSGIASDGNPYGIPEGIIFSFPCRTLIDGSIEIVKDMPYCPSLQPLIEKTVEELQQEKNALADLLACARGEFSPTYR